MENEGIVLIQRMSIPLQVFQLCSLKSVFSKVQQFLKMFKLMIMLNAGDSIVIMVTMQASMWNATTAAAVDWGNNHTLTLRYVAYSMSSESKIVY